MKITATTGALATEGVQDHARFKIDASSKAFDLISSRLYQNKIRAVIRELSTNAFDAHIMCDCAQDPFQVTLPTEMNPVFSVRDWGPGMCHNTIMNVYTTYFRSTKDDDNRAVGGFGLGSKSPFAYVSSFSVVSYHEGIARYYTAALGDRGPEIVLLKTHPTDQPSGLEVSMPVKTEDIKTFQLEAQEVYRWFSTPPKTNIQLEYPEKNVIFSGRSLGGVRWQACEISTYQRVGSVVVMGNVCYPIDYKLFNNNTTALLMEHIIIHAPVGWVDMTPSRESLSYDQQTIDRIQGVIDDIAKQLTHKTNAMIAKQPDLWHAYAELCRSSRFTKYFTGKIQWRGQEVPRYGFSVDLRHLVESGVKLYQLYASSNRMYNNTDHDINVAIEKNCGNIGHWIIGDGITKKQLKLIKLAAQQNKIPNVTNMVDLKGVITAEQFRKLFYMVDPQHLTDIKDYESLYSASTRYRNSGTVLCWDHSHAEKYVKSLRRKRIARIKDGFKSVDQPCEQGYYVRYYRGNLADENWLPLVDDIPSSKSLYNLFEMKILPDLPVYAVTSSKIKEFEDNPSWQCLYDTIRNRLEQWIDNQALLFQCTSWREQRSINLIEKIISLGIDLPEQSQLTDFAQQLNMKNTIEDSLPYYWKTTIEFWCKFLKIDPKKETFAPASSLYNQLTTKYPILSLLEEHNRIHMVEKYLMLQLEKDVEISRFAD